MTCLVGKESNKELIRLEKVTFYQLNYKNVEDILSKTEFGERVKLQEESGGVLLTGELAKYKSNHNKHKE